MDSAEEDQATDYIPTAALDDEGAGLQQKDLRTLNEFLKRATALEGPTSDAKLGETAELFLTCSETDTAPSSTVDSSQTARYVAEHLERILKSVHPTCK